MTGRPTGTAAAWLTSLEVAEKAKRHQETVLLALRRGLLEGSQAGPKKPWRINEAAFDDWMRRGAPYQAHDSSAA